MSIADALSAKRRELIELMVQTSSPAHGTTEADVRQFVVGYFNIVLAAADGSFGPRDEYLGTVLPSLRDAGMPLSIIMDGMVRVATATAATLGTEHAAWLCSFQGDYCARILAVWEGA